MRGLLIFAALVAVAVGVTGCAVYTSMSSNLPDPDVRQARGRDQSTVIADRNGKTLVRLYAEQNRQDVALEKIPEHLRQAVIATEDQRFYEHEGVDPLGIARAVVVDVIRQEKAQGGSTITQQYVKQAFVTSEKTLKRKIQEAILARKVEQRYSKDEILELYLNTIYFGHGAYGVEAASRVYFGKSVEDVSVAQAAVLAGVIKSPGRYSPHLDKEAALARRNTVLSQMKAEEYLSAEEYAEAVDKKLKVVDLKPLSTRAPYFVEWIKNNLIDKYGKQAVYRGGLRVKTTLDLKMQKAAENAVSSVLNQKGDPSAAVVAIRPSTGEVVAMVGGRNFSKQQYNVAVQGQRQPGSAFKPFVLATALKEGVSPEQSFKSGARTFQVGSQTWRVTGSSTKAMRLRAATEKSVNSVFAQLILDVGPEDVVATGEKMGLHKGIEPVPAIALGGLEDGVSPLEMARAYATLASGGRRPATYGIARVADLDGKVLQKTKPKSVRALDPAVAYLTTDILTGVIERGTGTAAQIGRPAAGKTGTTQQYRDAWFVGYTPDLVTAVWVGYPDSQKEMDSVHGISVTGGTLPAQIWSRFMKSALEGSDVEQFVRPAGLTRVKVCSETGGAVTEFCPKPISALVLVKSKPEPCEEHTKPEEVKVPSVVGLTKVDALAKLEKATLKVTVKERQVSGAEDGTVVSQNPAAGTKVDAESGITIVVATGGASSDAPVPSFEGPATAKAGEKVSYDASPSTDDGRIVSYYWEFGDGGTATKQKVSHAWSSPGVYEITLWVTDDAGLQGSITRRVTVR
ncbi:MAG TPA: PBP1A family penicillin-binding protein [Coriobacteriia bacterium]|nr:PBP1A family penicillin-binding protein [Coriobacteriia bacterium]